MDAPSIATKNFLPPLRGKVFSIARSASEDGRGVLFPSDLKRTEVA